MGRETKFGLLVGVVFIVLFGIILSGRAGSSVSEHAALPTGESIGHRTMVQALRQPVDPFVEESGPLVVGQGPPGQPPGPVVPAEEPLPAPKDTPVEEAAKTPLDDTGTVAFGPPAIIETPGGRQPGIGPARGDAKVERPGGEPAEPAPRVTYTVRPGDTLISIARHFYGREAENCWKRILEANKGALKDERRLAVGQKLVIPSLPAETPPALTPKKEAPPETGRDSAIVDSGKAAPPASRAAAIREALKGLVVEEPARPAPREPAKGDVPRVTADELGRMLGRQGDFCDQPPKPPTTYTVQSGDTFYKIADKLYGSGPKYGRLLAVRNQHLVSDPSRLKVGQRILLLDGVETVASDSAVALR